MNTKISVIIPTYKPQCYLWECLDSICNQSFPKEEFELILVLNGCDEPYNEQICEYINSHPEINWHYIKTDVGGVSNARNIGIDISTGEYIAFIDDDDFVSPKYLEELNKHAGLDTIPVCYPLSFIDGKEEYTDYIITKDYNKYCDNGRVPFYKPRRFFNGPVYKLIHRDIIGDRRFDIRFKNGEDTLFMFLISDRMKYVDFTSRNAIYYRRIRNDSATSKRTNLFLVLKNLTKLALIYTRIFLSCPSMYSFSFYSTRILGMAHTIVEKIHRNEN